MRADDILDNETLAALARVNEIEATSVARIERLLATAGERDQAGKPTKVARTAQQALGSPALTSTLPSVALRRSINPSLDAAIDEVQRAEIDYRIAVASMRALHARKELFEGTRGTPRKRVVEEHDLAPEEWKFVREMRARNVPVSAMDQLTEPELDFVGTLFVDKQKDMRHRERAGAWWTLVRAGSLDIASEAFNDEERAAIIAARPADEESAQLAYDALCDLAGRQLDVPPAFAQFVLAYAKNSSTSEPVGGFEKSVDRIHAEQRHADAEKLLELLGLPINELRRAFDLMRSPALISFTEHLESTRAAVEARIAAHRAMVDRYRPAARQALTVRHEAERRQERELIGADELGNFNSEAALDRLGANSDDVPWGNASIIRQVRDGTFLQDRDAERRRTVDELAARLVDSPAARAKLMEMGIALPDDDEDAVQPIVANAAPRQSLVPNPVTAEPEATSITAAVLMPTNTAPPKKNYGLPDDITSAAADAYYKIAVQFTLEFDEWKEATYCHASSDRNNPDDVARMRQALEKGDRRGILDEVCSRYLEIWKDKSIAAADDYLVDLKARKLINLVATSSDYADHRRLAGFPRPSQ